MYFAETSAKTGSGVERIFVDIAKQIYHSYKGQLNKMLDEETASQSSKQSDISYMNRLQASGLRGYPG